MTVHRTAATRSRGAVARVQPRRPARAPAGGGDAAGAATARSPVSPVYETDPVGGPEQEPYLNAVVAIVPAADPFDLWRFTSAIEASRERERDVRWGPRTLDVDLIDVGGQRRSTRPS